MRLSYSPAGGNVTIDCMESDKDINGSIADEGIGIPKEFHLKYLIGSFGCK